MHCGAHVSIAGGLPNAPKNAAALGCEVFQIFSRSPRGGPAAPITDAMVAAFRTACETHGQYDWYIHAPYYVNLASSKAGLRLASQRILREELERGSRIGAAGMMTHLGSAHDSDPATALKAVAEGLRRILDGYRGMTTLLLEIAAGSGHVVGDTFEELGTLVRATRNRARVCLDTQHAFASGYDLRTGTALKKTLDRFGSVVGIETLALLHCNDSLSPFASHVDRHAHLGKGRLGAAAFSSLVRERRLKNIDFVIETPTEEGMKKDLVMLKSLRRSTA